MPVDQERSSFQLALGVASPLWPAFAVAATAGAAFWWMSRWSFGQWRPDAAKAEATNLEAVLEATAEGVDVKAVDLVEETAAPVVEALAKTVETPAVIVGEVAQPVIESVAIASKPPVDKLVEIVAKVASAKAPAPVEKPVAKTAPKVAAKAAQPQPVAPKALATPKAKFTPMKVETAKVAKAPATKAAPRVTAKARAAAK